MKHKTIGELCHEKAARPVPFIFFHKKKTNKTKQNKKNKNRKTRKKVGYPAIF